MSQLRDEEKERASNSSSSSSSDGSSSGDDSDSVANAYSASMANVLVCKGPCGQVRRSLLECDGGVTLEIPSAFRTAAAAPRRRASAAASRSSKRGGGEPCTLDHCLRAICEAAELEGIECEQAACAGARQDASKKTLFDCLPKLLAFTIGRTDWMTGAKKIQTHVAFPQVGRKGEGGGVERNRGGDISAGGREGRRARGRTGARLDGRSRGDAVSPVSPVYVPWHSITPRVSPQDELVMTPYLDAEGGSGKQPLDSHKYRCYAVIVHHGRSMTQVRRRDGERKEEK